MIERYILEAIQKAVTAAVAASSTPTLPVKYIGRNFTPPNTGAWLEIVHIPNNVNNEFWADGRTYQGMFRLIFHWQMNDSGAYQALSIADSVASYFTKGLLMTEATGAVRVKVTDNPDLMGVIEEVPELILPVSIRYQFFKVA